MAEDKSFFDIEEELKKLPDRPGVYIMHDAHDDIIYVGKAVVLKNRVRQYFQSSRGKSVKIQQMVQRIRRFEYIVTDSELEALVLECNLIKEHRPKYNTMLKDDKGYPFIRVTVQEAFPRILYSHQMHKDKCKYYGPYTSATAVKDTIDLIRKLYKLRSCSRNLPRDIGLERPCLYYHIGQCQAPCQGYVTQEEYGRSLEQAMDFLNGNHQPVLKMLEAKMKEASEKMEFEKAMEYRDLAASVRHVAERQKITRGDGEDKDVMALANEGNDAVVQVFFIRGGKMIGRDHFYLQAAPGDSKSVILDSFVKQYYAGTPFVPRELMLETDIEDRDVVEQWLSEKRGQKVHVTVPMRGTKEKLVELARDNANIVLRQDKERIKREEGRTIGAVRELENLLQLSGIVRMEAFDISNISGFESVGSMIVYEHGKPKRNDYRKFKIRTVEGPNDYASMEEVLTRRFTHGLEEKKELEEKGEDASLGSFSRFPDLLMMDGGKGQVNIALQVLSRLNLDIPVCGMVKDDFHRTRGLYFNNEELPIDTRSECFKLITRVQDEAHRFAIEFHRNLRSKAQTHSMLEEIPGIGPARRKALLRTFKSMEGIRDASLEELANAESMNAASAARVYAYFHENNQEETDPPVTVGDGTDSEQTGASAEE